MKIRVAFLVITPLAALAPASAATVCRLVVEADSGKALSREGAQCEMRSSPASSFKLALALIGYEAGVLVDAHAPAWPYRQEYAAWRESWKTTIDPTSWMRESVVWYSREITARLGAERFQQAIDRLGYGNRDLAGDPGRNNGLTNAWLGSSLAISPAEQVSFLRNLSSYRLPFSREAIDGAIAIMPQFELPDGWTVRGKTGTGSRPGSDGKADPDRQFGWFVGWAQKGERRVVFADLLEDDAKIDGPAGWRARDELLASLSALLAGR